MKAQETTWAVDETLKRSACSSTKDQCVHGKTYPLDAMEIDIMLSRILDNYLELWLQCWKQLRSFWIEKCNQLT